jgi:hypothetical protein
MAGSYDESDNGDGYLWRNEDAVGDSEETREDGGGNEERISSKAAQNCPR